MTTKRELIEAKAIELLKSNPQGMRTSQLINAIKEDLPDVHPKNHKRNSLETSLDKT